eukprot:16561-Heterococcus_DN1.PRE.3
MHTVALLTARCDCAAVDAAGVAKDTSKYDDGPQFTLHPPNRDHDLDGLLSELPRQFVIETNDSAGTVHYLSCDTPYSMRQWVIALRDEVDTAYLEAVAIDRQLDESLQHNELHTTTATGNSNSDQRSSRCTMTLHQQTYNYVLYMMFCILYTQQCAYIRSPVGVSGSTDIYRHFPAVSGATTAVTATNTAMPSRASRNSSIDSSTASTHGAATATTTAAANTAFITTLMGHHSGGDTPKGSVTATSSITASSRSLSFSTSSTAAAAAAAADANTTRTVVCVRVRADGPTKVLEFTEQGGEIDESLVNSEAYPGNSSRHGTDEVFRDGVSHHGSGSKAAAAVTQLITATVHSVGISVIDDGPKELLYTYMQGLQIACSDCMYDMHTDPRLYAYTNLYASAYHYCEQVAVVRTDEHRCLSFTIERLQIDNQLSTALYPPLLRARPLAAMTTTSSNSSASNSSNRIVLDGLPSRPANNPPSIHFYTKRLCTAAS